MFDELRGRLDDDLGGLVEAVLERTGYRRELEASTDPQGIGPPGQPQRISQRRARIPVPTGECRRTWPRRAKTSPTPVLAGFSGTGVAGRRRR